MLIGVINVEVISLLMRSSRCSFFLVQIEGILVFIIIVAIALCLVGVSLLRGVEHCWIWWKA